MKLGDIGRRLYADLVRRRARVRVVPAVEPDLESPPIFLVGVYRSGTTLLRYLFDSHPRIACPPESDFLSYLRPVAEIPRSSEGLASLGYDAEHVRLRLRLFASYFFENYARSQGKSRWADKSPQYVDDLDFVRWLYPEARFVIIHRHPLDQVHSHTRGGTYAHPPLEAYREAGVDLRVAASRYWADKTAALLAFEAEHPDGSRRVRYEELCQAPEDVMRSLLDFVGEAWDPAVLDFESVAHDYGKEARVRPGFDPSTGHYQRWPAALVTECRQVVAAPMAQLGYEP